MTSDATSRCPTVADDEEPAHGHGLPTTLTRNLESEARLPVERRKHRLLIGNDRFDLDEEDDPATRMPGQHVDGSTFSSDPERRFEDDLPSGDPKHRCDELGQACVVGIKEAIECLAVPIEPEVEARSERLSDLLQVPDRHPARLPELDSHDLAAVQPGCIGQILLAPLPAMTQRADPAAEPNQIYRVAS